MVSVNNPLTRLRELAWEITDHVETRKEKGSARSCLEEQSRKDMGEDRSQGKGCRAGCSAQLCLGRQRDFVHLSPAQLGQRQAVAAPHSFCSCSLSHRESLLRTMWESQPQDQIQPAPQPMPSYHHVEQFPVALILISQ